jgi:hypothetical protein
MRLKRLVRRLLKVLLLLLWLFATTALATISTTLCVLVHKTKPNRDRDKQFQ